MRGRPTPIPHLFTQPVTSPEPGSIRPQPPPKLGKHGFAPWNAIQAEFHVNDAGGIEVLAQACAGVERAKALRARIDAEGETFQTHSGIKPHPCLQNDLSRDRYRAWACWTSR